MKNLLRLEEFAQFLLCLFVFIAIDVPWWAYILLLIGPDISMLGYLVNPRVGAITYNVFHHKAAAVLALAMGLWLNLAVASFLDILIDVSYISGLRSNTYFLIGIIVYGHSCMDRMLGFGLKYADDFKHTHLGWIGGSESSKQRQ